MVLIFRLSINFQKSFLIIGLGVNLVFLPTYSPELNPCELVFAQVKKLVRNARGQDMQSVLNEIILAFDSVTLENVVNYFGKCIYPRRVLPEL
jgi:hypothetical protein